MCEIYNKKSQSTPGKWFIQIFKYEYLNTARSKISALQAWSTDIQDRQLVPTSNACGVVTLSVATRFQQWSSPLASSSLFLLLPLPSGPAAELVTSSWNRLSVNWTRTRKMLDGSRATPSFLIHATLWSRLPTKRMKTKVWSTTRTLLPSTSVLPRLAVLMSRIAESTSLAWKSLSMHGRKPRWVLAFNACHNLFKCFLFCIWGCHVVI